MLRGVHQEEGGGVRVEIYAGAEITLLGRIAEMAVS